MVSNKNTICKRPTLSSLYLANIAMAPKLTFILAMATKKPLLSSHFTDSLWGIYVTSHACVSNGYYFSSSDYRSAKDLSVILILWTNLNENKLKLQDFQIMKRLSMKTIIAKSQ